MAAGGLGGRQTRGEQPDRADLIGKFHAGQRRERMLINNRYSHYVIVFRSGIALLETAHELDAVMAAIRNGSVALEVAKPFATLFAAPHLVDQVIAQLQNGDSWVAKLVGCLSETGEVDAKLAGLRDLTPELLDQTFPERVTGVPIDEITCAVLNRGPLATTKHVESMGTTALTVVPFGTRLLHLGPLVAELVIKHRVPGEKNEGQLWLRPDRSELWLRPDHTDPLDEVARMMRQALGTRFREEADTWRAVRGVFPGRGFAIER
jgi:hypothetical protein